MKERRPAAGGGGGGHQLGPRHGHGPKRGPKVGVGLSLEKFATAKASGFDKREVIKKQRELQLRKKAKYNKLKKKLEGSGVLLRGVEVKDSVREMEEIEGRLPPSSSGSQHSKQGKAGEVRHQGQGHQRGAGAAGGDDDGGDRAAGGAPAGTSGRGDGSQRHLHPKHGRARVGDGAAAAGSGPEAEAADAAAQPDDDAAGHKQRKHKAPSRLQRLAQEVEAKREEQRRAHEEAAKARAERQAKVEEAERGRKKQKAQYMKRTARGQPVMKYRMDKILAALQGGG